jgi:hypothetical protein
VGSSLLHKKEKNHHLSQKEVIIALKRGQQKPTSLGRNNSNHGRNQSIDNSLNGEIYQSIDNRLNGEICHENENSLIKRP